MKWTLIRFWQRLHFLFTGDCLNCCDHNPKMGCIIPEADCPVHDRKYFIH